MKVPERNLKLYEYTIKYDHCGIRIRRLNAGEIVIPESVCFTFTDSERVTVRF